MSRPIVFFDIAGPDEPELRAFYAKIFDWPCGAPGSFQPGNSPTLGGHIRSDPKEVVLYVGVEDVTATLTAIEAAGGSIDVPRFEAPGVAVLGLFRDPAGNRLGLVEMQGDNPIIP
jgi:predicted enzyme related to lactoylglutathione lyase